MLLKTLFYGAFAVSCVSATASSLYVSSYPGSITSLSLSRNPNGSYNFKQSSSTTTSASSPSWLTLDKASQILYSIDEGLSSGKGNIATYQVDSSGHFTQKASLRTLVGGVSSVLYGNGNSALAVAHYGGSAVTTYTVSAQGAIQALQTFTFTMSSPGPNAGRQNAPHPHQVFLDPTKTYLLAPDLGADLVRIFRIDYATNKLTALTPLKAQAGSGPRHGVFWSSSSGVTYLYLIAELGNTITSYKVTYLANKSGLSFVQIQVINTFAGGAVPAGTAAAEVGTSVNGRYLLVSDRGDNASTLPYGQKSDSMASYSINQSTGAMSPVGVFAAGGSFPRQFSLNKNGTLAAVGLQRSSVVVILPFDATTGRFGQQVAQLSVSGGLTCSIWNE